MAEAFKFSDDWEAKYGVKKDYEARNFHGIAFQAPTNREIDFAWSFGNISEHTAEYRHERTSWAESGTSIAIDFYTGEPLTHDFENIQDKAQSLNLNDNKFCKFGDLVEKGLAKNLDPQQLIKDGKAFEVKDWVGDSQIYCSASAVPELTANQTLAFDSFIKQLDSEQFQLKPREAFASNNQYILENCILISDKFLQTPLAKDTLNKVAKQFNEYRVADELSALPQERMQPTIEVAKKLFPYFLAKELGFDLDIINDPTPKNHSIGDIKYGEQHYNDILAFKNSYVGDLSISMNAYNETAGAMALNLRGVFEKSFDKMVDQKLERANAIVSKEEPAKAEPQKQEPTKAEQAPAEPAKAEPQKQEPTKAEQAKTLSGRIDEAKAYTIQAYRKIIEPFKQLIETMNKSRVMVAVNEHFKSLAKSLSTDKQQSAQKNTPEVKQQSKAKDMER